MKAVEYSDCDYERQTCVTKTAQDGVIPPEAVDCSEDVSICQSHYACSPERTCERYGGPLPVGTASCDTDKDCLPTTAFVCDLGACVEKYVGDKQVVDCEDPAEGEFCRCDPNGNIPNFCKKPEEPDTGVNGAALAITIMALSIFIAGLRLIF